MTDAIQIAVGSNNAGGLASFPVSPDTDGLQYPREIFTTSGGHFDGKPFHVLRFPDILTPEDWVATLALCGLSSPSVKSALVTARLPGENKTAYANWNGTAMRSRRTAFEFCWYKAPEIIITRLVAL